MKKRIKYGLRDHRGVLCQPPSQRYPMAIPKNSNSTTKIGMGIGPLLINHWVLDVGTQATRCLRSTEVADANGHAGPVFGATVTNSALVETRENWRAMSYLP